MRSGDRSLKISSGEIPQVEYPGCTKGNGYCEDFTTSGEGQMHPKLLTEFGCNKKAQDLLANLRTTE
jgi:hypothetical protein